MSEIPDQRFLMHRSCADRPERDGSYMLATIVAAFVTSILLVVAMSTMRSVDPMVVLGKLPPLFATGWVVIVITALPGFVATITIASITSVRHPLYFVVCGILTAISAMLLLACTFAGEIRLAHRFIWSTKIILECGPMLAGGAAGGYTYWRSLPH